MPTYSLELTASDNTITTNRAFGTFDATKTTSTILILALTTEIYNVITPQFYPNTTSAPTGSATLTMNNTVTNMNITITAQLIRVNSTGTAQTSGTTSAGQTVAATNTFTLTYPSWVGAACSDRLRLVLRFTNSAMTEQSFSYNPSTSSLSTSLNHNGTGCAVNRQPNFTNIIK